MDFLEMDFDPGPSCDAESDESSANIDLKECGDFAENSDNFNRVEIKPSSEYQKKDLVNEQTNQEPSCSKSNFSNSVVESRSNTDLNNVFEPKPGCSKSNTDNCCYELTSACSKSDSSLTREFSNILPQESQPSSSKSENNIFCRKRSNDLQNNLSILNKTILLDTKVTSEQNMFSSNKSFPINRTTDDVSENNINSPWIPKHPSRCTKACKLTQDSKGHHSAGGDLISWSENILPTSSSENRLNSSSSLYHSTMEKKLVLDKQPSNVESSIEKTMIWTEQEAALKQITQISTSACGATAVINVLQALGFDIPSNERVVECVPTRLRANASPLLKYLQSRSCAGSTHRDLILGLEKLTDGSVYARFFHMFPERYINLSSWLSFWIKKGNNIF